MQIDYNDYKKLIFKLAHNYSSTTGIEYDELVSAANEEFVKCLKTYDSEKAKFQTYLTWKVRGLFLEMSRKRNVQNNRQCSLEEANLINQSLPEPEDILFFKEILEELSSDAKEVIKIVFETPWELIQMLPPKQPRGINKHQIKKYLRNQGWPFPKILISFQELTESLKS